MHTVIVIRKYYRYSFLDLVCGKVANVRDESEVSAAIKASVASKQVMKQ